MSKSLDTLTKAFDRVFFYMHDQELQFIRDYDLNLSIIDLRVLSFIDMLSLTKHNQPKYITEKSRIHFSTISSMLKVLEKKDYILRKQNQEDKRAFDIFLTKMAKNIVNDYMTLRMTIHDNIQNHLSKKAYTQIVYAFENLQTFTESYAQRFKT
jgi:DNA-binding MarR family transcriptional regulator